MTPRQLREAANGPWTADVVVDEQGGVSLKVRTLPACTASLGRLDRHEGTAEPHTCPYDEDINDDHETLCHCCRACEQECCDDI